VFIAIDDLLRIRITSTGLVLVYGRINRLRVWILIEYQRWCLEIH